MLFIERPRGNQLMPKGNRPRRNHLWIKYEYIDTATSKVAGRLLLSNPVSSWREMWCLIPPSYTKEFVIRNGWWSSVSSKDWSWAFLLKVESFSYLCGHSRFSRCQVQESYARHNACIHRQPCRSGPCFRQPRASKLNIWYGLRSLPTYARQQEFQAWLCFLLSQWTFLTF